MPHGLFHGKYAPMVYPMEYPTNRKNGLMGISRDQLGHMASRGISDKIVWCSLEYLVGTPRGRGLAHGVPFEMPKAEDPEPLLIV